MKAAIIGGGVAGLFSAWYLREAGWQVSVIDRGDMLNGCSSGNAGIITPSHFVPLAAPGVWKQGFKWMLQPGSPFGIRPQLSREMLRWGFHFVRSSTAVHAERSAVPLRDMLLTGRSLYEELVSRKALGIDLQKKGLIMYYRTQAQGRHERSLAEKAAGLGLETEICDRDRLREMDPGLRVNALGGVHYKCDAHLHPGELIGQLLSRLGEKVRWIRMEVTQFSKRNGKIIAAVGKDGEVAADLFVLAGGCWSGALAARLGLRLPVMPGKGYSVTLENPRRLPVCPAILCEARVALTPMGGVLRYGGTMEIGPARQQVNKKRVEAMTRALNDYLPGLEVELPQPEQIWSGFRPVSADGLPYLGCPRDYRNLIIATGHSMLGIGMGPATGKIVAQLAAGEKPLINIAPFRPDRF